MEINNSGCLGPLSLRGISLFLNAKCTWRGLRSQWLPVCNLASLRLNTQPRRLWNLIQLERLCTLSATLLINAWCDPTDSICLWNDIIIVCPPFSCVVITFINRMNRDGNCKPSVKQKNKLQRKMFHRTYYIFHDVKCSNKMLFN